MPPVLLDGHGLAEQLDSRYEDVMSWARRKLIPSIRANGRVYFDLGKVCEALRSRRSGKESASSHQLQEVASC